MSENRIMSLTLTLENQKELGTTGRTTVKGKGGISYVVALDSARNVIVESVIPSPDVEYVFDGAQLSIAKKKYNFHC